MMWDWVANQLQSAYKRRYGSDTITSIGAGRLPGDGRVTESGVGYSDGLGILVWLGYDLDGKTPKRVMGQSCSGGETVGEDR